MESIYRRELLRMYNKEQIRMEWKKQLAIDFNCTIQDFDKEENVITIAKSNFSQWSHLGEILLFVQMKKCMNG